MFQKKRGMIAHPPCRGGRIRTCDLLVPNQARWPDYATPRANHQSYFKFSRIVLPESECKSNKFIVFCKYSLIKSNLKVLIYLAVGAGLPRPPWRTRWSSLRYSTNPAGSHPNNVSPSKNSAVGAGFEPAVQLPVRQFSKLVVSATHPSHLGSKELGGQK